MRKTLRTTTVALLCVLYMATFGDAASFGYTDERIAQHFYYMFFHASLLHLAANCIAAWFAIRDIRQFLLSYAIAASASFITVGELPTVGASGMLFACIGILHSRHYGVRFSRPHLATAFAITPGFFFDNINAMLHATCYAAGLLLPFFSNRIKSIANDYGRITGRH